MWNMSHICKFLLLLFMFAILCTKKLFPFYVGCCYMLQLLFDFKVSHHIMMQSLLLMMMMMWGVCNFMQNVKKSLFYCNQKEFITVILSTTTTTKRSKREGERERHKNSISLIYWKIIRKSNIKFLIIDLKQFQIWAELTHMMMMMYCCLLYVYCNFIYWSIKYLMALCKGNLKIQNRLLNRTFFLLLRRRWWCRRLSSLGSSREIIKIIF